MVSNIIKLGPRSKVYLKSLRDLDLKLEAIIAMSLTTHPPVAGRNKKEVVGG